MRWDEMWRSVREGKKGTKYLKVWAFREKKILKHVEKAYGAVNSHSKVHIAFFYGAREKVREREENSTIVLLGSCA